MDLKSVRRYQETLVHSKDTVKADVHYNEKILQTLQRIETKIDVILMQKDRRHHIE
ncbi:hypothetical protein [Lederbergia panacisoli]|uniref:hypothetical protein n=1 Tax=Lederbergia panacisoli TaxID=1255251 RepID=UPI00214BD8E0|nr:hypothetical protein [Lederbergia panacisoli]MCR2822210.1 hypothetical protein [Lederbergia panacisoli]